MNLLLCTSAHWRPEFDWAARAARRLIEKTWKQSPTWLLYNQNRDLLAHHTRFASHRSGLISNSFHHQTLTPFTAVVFAPTDNWTGSSNELLYGLLSKNAVPIITLSIDLADHLPSLSSIEQVSLVREQNILGVRNATTRDYLLRYDIDSVILPSPAPLAIDGLEALPQSQDKHIGIFVGDAFSPFPLKEKQIRQLHRQIQNLKDYHFTLYCPTVDDFLRFSSIFPENCFYSYQAQDYIRDMAKQSALIVNNEMTAAIANSLKKTTLWLGQKPPPPSIPHLIQIGLSDLADSLAHNLDNKPDPQKISDWKKNITTHWSKHLNRFPHPLSKAA